MGGRRRRYAPRTLTISTSALRDQPITPDGVARMATAITPARSTGIWDLPIGALARSAPPAAAGFDQVLIWRLKARAQVTPAPFSSRMPQTTSRSALRAPARPCDRGARPSPPGREDR